jgi:hypothetical protein
MLYFLYAMKFPDMYIVFTKVSKIVAVQEDDFASSMFLKTFILSYKIFKFKFKYSWILCFFYGNVCHDIYLFLQIY